MLQIKNLTLTHKYDLRVILEDFQLVLNQGDKAVIIGEEGNGKSTLLKWIFQPELTADYVEAEGERSVHGEKLGYLPQELPKEDREKTIYEFFCEEEMFWETDPRELADIASKMGLKADFFYRDQKMQTLSGGEKVKVQMAKLLVGKPSVFLLDEPSNDIDIDTLEWLEKLIQETPQAVLFISHDETLIENTANMVIHLEQICRKTKSRYTVVHTGYREYLESRNLNFENQRRKALNDRREEKKRQEKFNRIREKVQNDLNSVSRQDPHSGYLLKKKMRAVKSMERRFDREAEEMDHAISELSGGQKAKILLLKMSLSGADVLILDEPTRNFSPLSNPVIREILAEYQGAVISISHDRKYIHEVCGTVYHMSENGLVRVR